MDNCCPTARSLSWERSEKLNCKLGTALVESELFWRYQWHSGESCGHGRTRAVGDNRRVCGAGRLLKNCSWLRHNESLKPGFDSELCRGFRCVIRPESDLCLSQSGQGARRYLCPEQGSVLGTR